MVCLSRLPAALLRREQRAVRGRGGCFALLHGDGRPVRWLGDLCTAAGNTYRVVLMYPAGFPDLAPCVWVLRPLIAAAEHLLLDWSLCVFYDGDGSWQPDRTASDMLDWASLWLYGYERWRWDGTWGVPNVPGKGGREVVRPAAGPLPASSDPPTQRQFWTMEYHWLHTRRLSAPVSRKVPAADPDLPELRRQLASSMSRRLGRLWSMSH